MLGKGMNLMAMMLVCTACGIAMIHTSWIGTPGELLRTIAITAWALGIATQAYSTTIIAWEIWRRGIVNTSSSRSSASYYKAIMAMVVESGIVYTVLVLLLTITFALGFTSARIVLAVLLEPMGVGHLSSFDCKSSC